MTTVVSTCLEKWEFLKFVIIWKAETWLQTQKSEHCTSLHCTALQCNRYKRPAPGQNFNSPQLPPNYYCYPSFVLWTFGDHEQNEQNGLTTIVHYILTYTDWDLFFSEVAFQRLIYGGLISEGIFTLVHPQKNVQNHCHLSFQHRTSTILYLKTGY